MLKIYLLFLISFISLILNFIPVQLVSLTKSADKELFNEELTLQLNSVNTLAEEIDRQAYLENCIPHSLEYNEIVTNVIKYRFRHGYCYYSLNQNWVAASLGYFFWEDLAAIVIPDDILKYSNAACSQQSIVMMEILRRKGIPFKKVGWNHHFTLCAWVQNSWHFYDPNMEPIINMNERKFDSKFNDIEFLAKIYHYKIPRNHIEQALGKPYAGVKNEFPANRIRIFHYITFWISKTVWFFVLIYGLWLFYKRRKAAVYEGNYEI